MICMLAFICGKCENYTQNIIPYSKNIYNHNKILITVYIVTFLIILPLLLHDVTNSIYFVPSAQDKTAALNNIREINDARLLDADEFLSTYARDTSPSLIRLDVAITVITVSRNRNSPDAYRPQYLKQTVVSLLTGLARHGMAADLSLCNVDADPDAYAEAANMSAYVARTFARFSPTRYVTDEHRLEKEKRDYVYCINETLRRTTAGHVFVLEDDALAHRDMFPLLRYTVERRFTAANSRPAYVKFFHPRWLIGFYSLDSNRLASLWACSTLLAAAAYPVRRWLSRNIGFWACCVYFSLVLISIGCYASATRCLRLEPSSRTSIFIAYRVCSHTLDTMFVRIDIVTKFIITILQSL